MILRLLKERQWISVEAVFLSRAISLGGADTWWGSCLFWRVGQSWDGRFDNIKDTELDK